jgi:hypothetical protein
MEIGSMPVEKDGRTKEVADPVYIRCDADNHGRRGRQFACARKKAARDG